METKKMEEEQCSEEGAMETNSFSTLTVKKVQIKMYTHLCIKHVLVSLV